MNYLSILANFAAICTAIVAVFGYRKYCLDQCKKRKKLEEYLKAEKIDGKDQGQRSLLRLVAKVGMTEDELIQASFRSKHIIRKVTTDEKTGMANTLLLEWKD